MALYKPRTIKGVADRLAKNVFVSSKVLRKAIDRDKKIQQLAIIPGKYADRYEALRKETEAMVQEFGKDSRKVVPGTRLQVRSAQRIFGGGGNFRQQKRFLEQIMPEMKESHELGHKNISVLRSNVALALNAMEKSDPRRPHLRALFQTIQELDKIVNENDIDKVNINYLLEQVQKTAAQKRSFKIDYKVDVDILKGVGGAIELEYEPIGLNQAKGKVSAFLGELFKDAVQEEGKKITQFFENTDISNLKGSPTIPVDVLDVITEQLDPKKKPKKRKRGRKPQNRNLKSATTVKATKKKVKAVQAKRTTRKGVSSNPLQLIGLINKELPKTVRKNMREPALVNRTGRFAESVKVTDIVQTAKGFPSIGYTYARNPYEVFEMGSSGSWSSPERDPRHLIDKSIREIAAQFAIGRFYTRRV
jgi:hypothetical protein